MNNAYEFPFLRCKACGLGFGGKDHERALEMLREHIAYRHPALAAAVPPPVTSAWESEHDAWEAQG